MVDRRYLLNCPPPPSAWKVFVDQRVIPAGVNGAATLERATLVARDRVRRAPFLSALAGLAGGLILSHINLSRSRRF